MPQSYPSREAFEADYPNVKGTGFGPKYSDGKRVHTDTRTPDALIVLVTRKYAKTELDPDEQIPELVLIDGTIYETDVEPIGIPHGLGVPTSEAAETEPPEHRERHRPIPGGVSMGNEGVGAGTLGSPLLYHEDDPVILTNSHVGGEAEQQYQPASMDGGAAEEPFGYLREASPLDPGETQTTDSALIDVDPDKVDDWILGIGELVDFGEPEIDAEHTKAGRTTGVTTGTLRARDAAIDVAYGPDVVRVSGCDIFSRMSKAGDSGSLIGRLTARGFVATDLLFAGSSEVTIGVPMTAVMDYHGELVIPDGKKSGPKWGQFRYQAKCERVVDGDTLYTTLDLGFRHHFTDQQLRLATIDTAERGHADYEEHTEFVEDWIATARAEHDGDWPLIVETLADETGGFGRWLAHVQRKSDGMYLDDALRAEYGEMIRYDSSSLL